MKTCECGCGNEVSCSSSKFCRGYNRPFLGKKYTEEEKLKMSIETKKRKDWNKRTPIHTKEMREKYKRTMLKKYGVEYPLQSKQIKEKFTNTIINRYGVLHHMQSFKCQQKITKTNITNGRWIPRNLQSNYTRYYYTVMHFTNKSIQTKYSKEELLIKRKKAGIEGAFHIDHKFSVQEGFKNNILPCIIGSSSNLDLIPWKDNHKKSKDCSISKEELFTLYNTEIKGEEHDK